MLPWGTMATCILSTCYAQRPLAMMVALLHLSCAADIKESIAQLKYYRHSIFKKWAGMF